MTVLYTNNFDTTTVGTLPTGWTNHSGLWVVGMDHPISGLNTFGESTRTNGSVVVYTSGSTSQADQLLRVSFFFSSTTPNSAPMIRCDSTGGNGYLALLSSDGTLFIFKSTSFSYSVIASQPSGLTDGTNIYLEILASGSTIEARAWSISGSRPTSPTVTATNSTYTAGTIGLYNNQTAAGVTGGIDDLVWTDGSLPSTSTATLTGPTTGTVGVASTNFTVTLSTTAGTTTTITPSDSGGGGTFTPTTVSIAAGAATGTFTYTAGSAGAKSISITSTNGYTPAGSPITFTASAPSSATTVTLSGPSSGSVGVGQTLTATLNGTLGASCSVTFADTLSGTFSPNPVVIAAGSTSGTTTFTPSVTGSHSISITNGSSLTNTGTPLAFTASSYSGTIPVDAPGLTWSPANWDFLSVGTFGVSVKTAQTTACGAYLKFSATGTTSIALAVDTTTTAGFGSNMPRLMWTIGGGVAQYAQIPDGATTFSLATGLTAGDTYSVDVWVIGTVESTSDRWGTSSTSPYNVVRIKNVLLDSGGTVSYHPLIQPKKMVFYGDSIVEGVRAAGTTTEPADHGRSVPWYAGPALGCEYGVIGYGATGWTSGGWGNMPGFVSYWNYYSNNRPRSLSGIDYLFVMHGYNGGGTSSDIQTWVSTVRASYPSIWIFIVNAPSGRGASAHISGVNAYKAANPSESRVFCIDYSDIIAVDNYNSGTGTPNFEAIDGIHPLEWANAMISGIVVRKTQEAISGTGGGGGGGGTYPTAAQVLSGVTFGPTGSDYTGNVTLPAATNVRSGVSYGTSGTAQTGNMTLPTAAQVQSGVPFGANGTQYTGTLAEAWSTAIEGGYTAGQLLKAMSAVLLGKSTGQNTNSPVFRDVNDTKNRVVATTDSSGNRSAVTLDLS